MPSKKQPAEASKNFVRFSNKVQESLDEMSKTVGNYASTMDTVQEVSIDLTRMVVSLATTAGQYAESVSAILKTAAPLIAHLPLIDGKTKEFLTNLESTAEKLLDVVKSAQTVAQGAEQGLTTGDAEKLQALIPELKQLPQAIEASLKHLKS
jgi:methyl-accepting chemotaxis protein